MKSAFAIKPLGWPADQHLEATMEQYGPNANVRSKNANANIIILKHTQIRKDNYKNISIGWREDQNNYRPKFSDS